MATKIAKLSIILGADASALAGGLSGAAGLVTGFASGTFIDVQYTTPEESTPQVNFGTLIEVVSTDRSGTVTLTGEAMAPSAPADPAKPPEEPAKPPGKRMNPNHGADGKFSSGHGGGASVFHGAGGRRRTRAPPRHQHRRRAGVL